MKKLLYILLALTGALTLAAQEEKIPWQKDITMLMVPRDPVVVQVARDVAQNYPVLLVCYQQIPETGTPLLHAWDGSDWVSVTLKSYTNGTFFTTPPQHTVIVENEGQPAPDVLVPNESWCDSGNRLSSTDTRVLIHLLGRHFNLPYQ